MSENTPETQPQHGVGKTGGLPGANADPRAAEVTDDELGDTVSMGDVAPVPDSADDPQGDPPIDS